MALMSAFSAAGRSRGARSLARQSGDPRRTADRRDGAVPLFRHRHEGSGRGRLRHDLRRSTASSGRSPACSKANPARRRTTRAVWTSPPPPRSGPCLRMVVPGLMAVPIPVSAGFLDKNFLAGLPAGALVSGVLLAIFMANAGGALGQRQKAHRERQPWRQGKRGPQGGGGRRHG